MNGLRKMDIISLFVIVIIIFTVDVNYAQDSYLPEDAVSAPDVKGEQGKEESMDEVPGAEEEGEETKAEKVGKTISTVPERTGNVLLGGFHKIGNWIEDKSGNRFETKWNPQRKDDPSLSPEHYGFERDPAKGI